MFCFSYALHANRCNWFGDQSDATPNQFLSHMLQVRGCVHPKCSSIKHDHCSDLLNFEKKGFKRSDADKNNIRLRSDEIDNNIIFSCYHTRKICIFRAKSQTPILFYLSWEYWNLTLLFCCVWHRHRHRHDKSHNYLLRIRNYIVRGKMCWIWEWMLTWFNWKQNQSTFYW